MRKTLVAIGIVGLLAQPLMALADDGATVEKTSTTTSTTSDGYNPIGQVLLFPVRLVTAVIGVPIGMVGGAFTGFVKGFEFPDHHDNDSTTTTTTKVKED